MKRLPGFEKSPACRAHLAWRATPPAGGPLCARRFIPTCDYQSAANSKLRVNARLGLAALVQVGMILSPARRRGSTSRQFGIDSQGCRGSSRPRLDGSAAVRAQRDGTRKVAHSTSADRRGGGGFGSTLGGAKNKMAPTNGAISLLCRALRSTGRYEASPSTHGQRKRFRKATSVINAIGSRGAAAAQRHFAARAA